MDAHPNFKPESDRFGSSKKFKNRPGIIQYVPAFSKNRLSNSYVTRQVGESFLVPRKTSRNFTIAKKTSILVKLKEYTTDQRMGV